MTLARFLRTVYSGVMTPQDRRTAFDAFMVRHAAMVERLLSKRLWLGREDVEDLVQVTFQVYWEHYWHSRIEHPIGLLLAIANKLAQKKLRDKKKEIPLDEHRMEIGEAGKINANYRILFADLLINAKLSARDRLLLELRVMQQWSYPEISEALGVKEATLKSRVKRALEKLKKFYARERMRR